MDDIKDGRESEQDEPRLRRLVRNLPFCVHEIDADGRLLSMNQGGLDMLGIKSEADIVGVEYVSAVAAHDRERIAAFLAAALDGEGADFEFEADSDATPGRLFSSCFIPLRDTSGAVHRVLGYTMDITEERKKERELRGRLERASEERMALVQITKLDGFGEEGSLPSVRGILEIAARVLGVARLSLWGMQSGDGELRCEDLFEVGPETHSAGAVLSVHDYPSYFEALERHDVIDAHDAMSDPRTSDFAASYLAPNGITSMLDCPVRVPDYFEGVVCAEHVGEARHWDHDEVAFLGGVAAHLARVMYDARQVALLAEHVSLERQVFHAQKLESLGVLAGGIAHDFNNILTTVLGNADLALQMLPSHAPARMNIEEIEKGARHAADLAGQMLAYSGKGSFVTKPIPVNQFIEEMVHLLEVSIAKTSIMKFDLAEDLPRINADPTQFRQVVMNLVTNASEAIGDRSGIVAITTGAMYCDEAYLGEPGVMSWPADEPGVEKSLYVYLEVSDTGHGMDEETVAKVFDPFFTTKFSGRGLGLAATLGIVRGHHGAVKIYSEVGKGTTFRVLFPAIENDEALAEEGEGGAISVDPDFFSGMVLVADDVETVRGLARRMLERLGFDVITAPNGREAVRLYREHWARIRLVVLDLTMPHMGGEEAFREMRAINKQVCVVLCSGYSEEDIEQQFVGRGLAGFLQKPFNTADLQAVLTDVLSPLDDDSREAPSA